MNRKANNINRIVKPNVSNKKRSIKKPPTNDKKKPIVVARLRSKKHRYRKKNKNKVGKVGKQPNIRQ